MASVAARLLAFAIWYGPYAVEFGALLIFAQTSAVAPFIYTLF